jgi:hypothetical protein
MGDTIQVRKQATSNEVWVTPTISTSPAYTSGDQIGGIMTIAPALRPVNPNSGTTAETTGTLTTVKILEISAQKAAIDIFFFNALPTIISVDNGAFNIANAEWAKWIGTFSAGTSYVEAKAATNAGSTDRNVNLDLELVGTSTLYAVAVVRGTPTYTSVSGLSFGFFFAWD